MLSIIIFLPFIAQQVLARPQPSPRNAGLNTNGTDNQIQWSSDCDYLGFEADVGFSCANFTVPLDYSNPQSSETLILTLTKVNATNQPAKGSILFNPGGPGSGGASFNIDGGDQFQTILGGNFDLIGFDPRGTGYTLRFDCYNNSAIERLLLSPEQNLGNSSDIALGADFAASQVVAAQCLETNAEIGGLLGTAFVARDMERIVDALGEDGLLRYWGFSYGTALGATFSLMFPEKVDKVILDGNVNVEEYWSGDNKQSMESLDGVVQGFYDGCASAPQNCELAQLANTSEAIAGLVNSALESLRYSPVVVTLNESSTTITYTDVKNKMFSSMYSPAKWRSQAKLLTRLIQGNYTGYVGLLKKASGGADDRDTPDAILGISCGDAAYRAKSIMDMNEYKDAVVATSQWGGLDFGLINTLSCAPWQMKAKEVYAGPWNAETKSPLLIIGNSYDPVTPLVSAQYNNEVFGGSALLQQNGYGHCTLAQPSLCTAKLVREYFNTGALPAPGTVCEPDVPLFSNQTWKQAFAPLGINGTVSSTTKRSVDDSILLDAMVKLSEKFHQYSRRS
ncbi:hypothetical protein LTS17_011251 [Exophiala oligosperma]